MAKTTKTAKAPKAAKVAKPELALEPYAESEKDAVYTAILAAREKATGKIREALTRVANQQVKAGNKGAVTKEKAAARLKKQLEKLATAAAKSGMTLEQLLAQPKAS